MIRKAKYSDIDCLSIIIYHAWRESLLDLVNLNVISKLSVDWFREKLEFDLTNHSCIVFVYEKNNEILGYVTGKDSIENMDAEIYGLYVSPKGQSSGIGSQLFYKIKCKFASINKSKMHVRTLLGAPNNQFYKKQKPVKTENIELNILDVKHRGIEYSYQL